MIRSKKMLYLCGLWLLLALLLVGCHRTPDEAQVRDAIAGAAHAAEAGSASAAVAPLSDDFDGNAGELDARAMANMIRLIALRGDHVGVTLGPIAIEHRGERMLATFTVSLSSGSKLLPDQLGVYSVESAWRREGRHWRCYSASWKHPL